MKEKYLYRTPVVPLLIEMEEGCIVRLDAVPCGEESEAVSAPLSPAMQCAVAQLDDYFAGRRATLDLPIKIEGTPFRQRVWQELRRIPYGSTRTYAQIAAAIGKPMASRAVGGACHSNHLLLLVPCHRVVGSDGSLTGFGAGLPLKEYLLHLESRGLHHALL